MNSNWKGRLKNNIFTWAIFVLIGVSTGIVAFGIWVGVHWINYARWT